MTEDSLARVLVERQFLDINDCRHLAEMAETEGIYLEEILLREDRFTRKDLLTILENHHFCPAVDLQGTECSDHLLTQIPRRLAERHLVFPIRIEDAVAEIAFANPSSGTAREAISQMLQRQCTPLVALRSDLRDAIRGAYDRIAERIETSRRPPAQSAAGTAPEAKRCTEIVLQSTDEGEDAATSLVDQILDEAIRRGATDIHIEPREHELTVRLRLDGILHRVARLSQTQTPSVTSRVKVLAGMDIAERRLPQDGRHTLKRNEELVDIRISSLPSQFGEKIVMRLLRKGLGLLDIDRLQMPRAIRLAFEEMIHAPRGFFLVTGPTGSGKTTTLYAALSAIDRDSVNIVTLEDPIEYTLLGITQVQVHEEIGLTFAEGLRAFLRQDPDVMLVGELRDSETVEIACRAALTGHKVLSTLHTNDAAQAVPRLTDMGAPSYLIAATLEGVFAQRLVRVNCESCRESLPADEFDLAILGYPKITELVHGRGCEHCSGTGFRGRMAIFEYLSVGANIQRLIHERASSIAIRHSAKVSDMTPMAEFAKRAVISGVTTVAEIQRVVLADESLEQMCPSCGQVVSIEFAVCPFCQHVLKEQCHGCGNPLEERWDACPHCGLEVRREGRQRHCSRCLAPVEAAWTDCPFCGGSLT